MVTKMIRNICLFLLTFVLISCELAPEKIEEKETIVFIGDSITYGHNGYDNYWWYSMVCFQ